MIQPTVGISCRGLENGDLDIALMRLGGIVLLL